MPNNHMDFEVDLLPVADATYNLGDSTHKWIVNGHTIGEAAEKGVDSSISSGSTSTNVPTTGAVVSFVSSALGANDYVNYKGDVVAYSNLPSSGQVVGDMYKTTSDGKKYVWLGSAWEDFIGDIAFDKITQQDVDEMCPLD